MEEIRKGSPPRYALIVGHPGHELRLIGWVKQVKPMVAVLTDGSGHGTLPRLHLTSDILQSIGATISNIYGSVTDRTIYSAILEQNHDFFLQLSDSLAKILVEHHVDYVVGDALEGYNPTHDLCRILINRAVRLASKKCGYAIKNYAFSLIDNPSNQKTPRDSLQIQLSAEELTMKIKTSRQYANTVGGMLVTEVEDAFKQFGEAAFGQEVIFPENTHQELVRCAEEKPFYETYGEKQVAAGHYQFVIRYHEHMVPIIKKLES